MGEPPPSAKRPYRPGRVWAERVGKLTVMVALFVCTGELAIRWLRPSPSVLVVRPSGILANVAKNFAVVDGHPIWADRDTETRLNPPCAPDAPEVWLVGDSIFFGVGLEPSASPGAQLQLLLDRAGAAACVRNLSQPGYGGAARHRAFLAELERRRQPDVVVIESWESDPMTLTRLDDAWYALADVRTDASGWPAPPVSVPTWAHILAFRHSRLWWYATLTAQVSDPDAMTEARATYRKQHYVPMIRQAQALGARVVTFVMPRLDRPFAASVSSSWEATDERALLREASADLGVPVIAIADRLVDEDVTELRQDTCCHVSPAGAEAYARAMLPEVLAGLQRTAPR